MKTVLLPLSCLFVLCLSTAAAQPGTPETRPTVRSSIDPLELIERLAEEMEREFIVDRRLSGMTGVSTAGADADYETLLGMLRTLGFIAVESGNQIMILPEAAARTEPTPLLQEDDSSVSDHAIVTRVIEVPADETAARNASGENGMAGRAVLLLPALRPMLSQTGLLTTVENGNRLVLVDRYDNVRRITAVVEALIR